MNKFTQRIPAYFDLGEPNPTFDFTDLNELLMHPIVLRYVNEDFTQWARSGDYLMAMSKDNKEWWAVGRVADDSVLCLLANFDDVKGDRE